MRIALSVFCSVKTVKTKSDGGKLSSDPRKMIKIDR